MKYISTKEAAQKWNVSLRRVQYFCANGMIPDARRMGRQWVIPADAERPADGRTRCGKEQGTEGYHFPVFVYSPLYADPSILDESEQKLLQAQILRLEGKYAKSIEVCREIISGYVPPYLAAGVYFTIGFDTMLMGITSEYRRALAAIDKLIAGGISHAEDIKLMRAYLNAHVGFDCAPVFAIKPERLSAEAIVYYKYCLLTASTLQGNTINSIGMSYFQSDLVQIEKDGITPALFSYHLALGSSTNPEISLEEREVHMRAAVDLAVMNGWTASLAKFYNGASTLIDKCLGSHGDSYVIELKKIYQISMKNWRAVRAAETGCDEMRKYSSEQLELLLLVSYGYSSKTIAAVKCMADADVENAIAELCSIADVSTKDELMGYAEKIFTPPAASGEEF